MQTAERESGILRLRPWGAVYTATWGATLIRTSNRCGYSAPCDGIIGLGIDDIRMSMYVVWSRALQLVSYVE